jgi:hypothetical protein
MIPGRFPSGYSFYSPIENKLFYEIHFRLKTLPYRMHHSFLRRFLESNVYIHLLDTFVETKEVDPFDDSRLRYVVRMYKYDEKRKQIVPTRAAASTTLRGAQKLASQLSVASGLPYTQDDWNLKEYLTIYGYRAHVDYEKARVRSWGRKNSGG